jgi:hypothetical protein
MNRLRPGHAQYAAPENLRASSDARSDLYALAAMLWEVFVGRPRVYEEPSAVTPHRVDLHPAWDVFFEHALANDPTYRAPTAGALIPLIEPLAGADRDAISALLAARVMKAFGAAPNQN